MCNSSRWSMSVHVCTYLQYRTHIERVGDSQKALTSIYTSRALGERRVAGGRKEGGLPIHRSLCSHQGERSCTHTHTHTTLYWPHGCVELEQTAVKAVPAPCLMQQLTFSFFLLLFSSAGLKRDTCTSKSISPLPEGGGEWIVHTHSVLTFDGNYST